MKHFSLRYTLLIYKLDQLWFPLAFWLLFVIIAILRGPAYILDTSRAYLGVVIPLVGGILGAYAILDDPALELRFSTPTPSWRLLAERLALLLALQALTALAFQALVLGLGVDFSPLGGWLDVQLAWFVPTFALMGLGVIGSQAGAQMVGGAFLVGVVWLVELIARGWLARNAGRYVLVFMGALMPEHPTLRLNQGILLALAVLFVAGSWALLRCQERYI